jgi:hypothetical protein
MWPGVAVQDDRRIWLVGGYDTRARSNIREIWYSDNGLEWKIIHMLNNIPYIHAPTCYVKDDTLLVVAGKGNLKSGVEQEAPQRVSNGVWSVKLPPLR